MENAALWMILGGQPLDLLNVSEPIEQHVMMDILHRAANLSELREKRMLENLAIAVSNAVAKAFGG